MPAPVQPLSTRLDGRGRLELAAVLLGAGALLTAASAHLIGTIRNEAAPSPTSWWLAAVPGLLAGAAAAAGTAWTWRRTGGRRLQRLGRQAWRTGRLPQGLALRVAVLRDLERRQRRLTDTRTLSWLLVVVYSGIAVLNLVADGWGLRSWTLVTALALIVSTAVRQTRDVRRLPQLQALIDELRADPAGVAAHRAATT